MRIIDRPEFESKPEPLTVLPEAMASEAIERMCERKFGSSIVVYGERRVLGILTERDVMNRLVNAGLDPTKTPVRKIMTSKPRIANADDNVLDWLRIMSNERFRRLPIVNNDGELLAVMTQGDFVSYTWPELVHQAKQLAKATVTTNSQIFLVFGGIAVYSLALVLILGQ